MVSAVSGGEIEWVLMTEEILTAVETETGGTETPTVEDSEAAAAAQEKCTRSHVLTVELRLKCLSSQQKGVRFTAGNAFQITESSKIIVSVLNVSVAL